MSNPISTPFVASRVKSAAYWTAALALAVGSVRAYGDDGQDAQLWLDRMAVAIDNLTYRGTLVYARSDQLDTLRILHRVDKSGVRERVYSVNGSAREVLRNGRSVRCIFPDSQSVLVDTRIAERLFPMIPPEQAAKTAGSYRFVIGEIERIANLDAQIILIAPRDRYRYGYRLWLELKTAMLLKSSLVDENGRPLEQLMFTDIDIGAAISDSDLEPELPEDGYLQVEMPTSGSYSRNTVATVTVRSDGGLAGFLLASRRQGPSDAPQGMEHLVFTDGLASVSVYVEPNREDAADGLIGHSHLGAINMFGLRVQGYSVTAVGEVPSATVELMARAIYPTALAASQ